MPYHSVTLTENKDPSGGGVLMNRLSEEREEGGRGGRFVVFASFPAVTIYTMSNLMNVELGRAGYTQLSRAGLSWLSHPWLSFYLLELLLFICKLGIGFLVPLFQEITG